MTDREKAIVMAYTGYAMLAGDKLGIYYQYVQEKLGRSVMTHELAYEEVQDAIKEAAKEDFIALAKDNNVPRNSWISVKDRLPNLYHMVLVTGRNSVGGSFGVIKGSYDGDEAGWYRDDVAQYANSREDVITHWMPLPESPEVKQDADD